MEPQSLHHRFCLIHKCIRQGQAHGSVVHRYLSRDMQHIGDGVGRQIDGGGSRGAEDILSGFEQAGMAAHFKPRELSATLGKHDLSHVFRR